MVYKSVNKFFNFYLWLCPASTPEKWAECKFQAKTILGLPLKPLKNELPPVIAKNCRRNFSSRNRYIKEKTKINALLRLNSDAASGCLFLWPDSALRMPRQALQRV
jgi:hypothetical protein